MDLLRIVLAYLPLQRYQDIAYQTDLIRLHRVNHEVARDLDREGYLAISTYQGELFNGSDNYISPMLLCSRAAFLGDVASFELFKSRMRKGMPLDFEIAMRSNSTQIQMAAMTGSKIEFFNDPGAIKWTSQLRTRVFSLLSTKILNGLHPDSDRLGFLYGYLYYPRRLVDARVAHTQGRTRKANYITVSVFDGYVTAAIEDQRDPFKINPIIEEAIGDVTPYWKTNPRIRVIGIGYFHGADVDWIAMNNAFLNIQPVLVEYLLDCNIPQSTWVGTANVERITISVVSRAHQMLELARRRNLHLDPEYEMDLLIITGQRLEGQPGANAVGRMIYVAHPQLSRELIGGIVDYYNYTTVLYDLPNLFSVFERPVMHHIHELVAHGQLWQCRKTHAFKYLTKEK